MLNQEISRFLERVVKANELLADNNIQNPMAYLEFATLFYALAEEARSLNKGTICPASAKCAWIQLSLDFSDSGWSSTAIKVNFMIFPNHKQNCNSLISKLSRLVLEILI